MRFLVLIASLVAFGCEPDVGPTYEVESSIWASEGLYVGFEDIARIKCLRDTWRVPEARVHLIREEYWPYKNYSGWTHWGWGKRGVFVLWDSDRHYPLWTLNHEFVHYLNKDPDHSKNHLWAEHSAYESVQSIMWGNYREVCP